MQNGNGWKSRKFVLALVGAATKDEVLCRDELAGLGIAVRVATDDGSGGTKGFVTGLLAAELASGRGAAALYACGPEGMWRPVAEIAHAHGVPCQISLEAVMACGTGVCHGCAFFVTSPAGKRTLRVCVDGPVFDSSVVLGMSHD